MENTEVKIVLGSAFGDEGKGVTVQYLCKEAIDKGKKPLVIRFSGGPQAAHTIRHNGIEHICSTYGSGVLLGVPTLIWDTAYFNPLDAKLEYEALKKKIKKVPPLYVMPKTRVVTIYDVTNGRRDAKVLSDGTCGRGIYPTFKRDKEGLHVYPDNFDNLDIISELDYYYYEYNKKPNSPEFKVCKQIMKDKEKGKYDFFSITGGGMLLSMFDVLIFEGSQGLLLDMDRGFYPNVTPSKTGLNAFTEDKFLEKALQGAEVYLVSRTYLTRHGNGYTPCQYGFNFDLSNKYESNVENQYQGIFKTGIMNFDLLNEAYNRHCLDNYWRLYNLTFNMVVTHFDLLDNVDEYKFIVNDKRTSFSGDEHQTLKDKVGEMFRFFADGIRIKDVYVNDSPESNLKKLDF